MELTGLLLMFGLLVLGGGIYLATQLPNRIAKKPELPLRGEDNFETAEDLFPPIEFPPEPVEEFVPELPKGYNEDKITVMARDPENIFAYWEVTEEKENRLRQNHGLQWDNSHPVVRIHDVTGINYFNGENANDYKDVYVDDNADRWYFHIGTPDRVFCAELGRKLEDGTFVVIARSNLTRTPRNTLSDKIDPEWMLVTEDQKKLYARIGQTGEFSSYHLFQQKQ